MTKKIYDLVVIGAGPAGTPVVMEYANLNPAKKILLVDKKGELGGECLFDGCIPSKILEVSGKYVENEEKFEKLGIKKAKIVIDWQKVAQKKKEILSKRTKAAKKKLLSFGNIDLVKDTAYFKSKNSIFLTKEKQKIFFKKAVIATGSRTFIPDFRGNGLDKIWTNDVFFDRMELPKSLTIIGAGPIGIELSQILANYGVKINLIGNRETILPMIEEKFSRVILKKIQENKNINLILNSDVQEINFEKEKFEVKYLDKTDNKNRKISSEKVLIATGRTPNIEDLKLEKAGVEYKNRGIITDKFLQTSNKDIYAAGDVVFHFPQFAHTASYGAHIIAKNLFFGRNKFKTNFDKISWVLFSNPNFASAGLSEKSAKKSGIEIITGEYDYSIDAKSQIENEDEGYLKFVVKEKTLQIIGVQVLHQNANAIAGEAALIVSQKLTLLDLIDSIHPHPTLSESFVFLAKQMMGEIMKKRIENPLFKVVFFIKKRLP